MKREFDFDYIVIGSGFGGSVSALRLAEKGYRVGVLEMGKRYKAEDFPHTNWNLRRYFWLPFLRLFGFFRMTLFNHAWVLSGVGVGGGSLVYAGTLLQPPDSIWEDPQWKSIKDGGSIMGSFYDRARTMLGVSLNQYLGPGDRILKEAAGEQGFGDSFYTTHVGIYFGKPGQAVPDPYFNGQGPERTGCIYCGGCMVGCRHGAKNSLDMNYLFLAEKQGVQVVPETRVIDVLPLGEGRDGSSGYIITTKSSTRVLGGNKTFTAKGVVFAAGVIGTISLLLNLKRESLPRLSERVGDLVRTNSESIIGVKFHGKNDDLSEGVAIGSGIYIDEHTHIEAVRYSKGSDALALTATLLTNGKAGLSRIFSWLGVVIRHPIDFLRMLLPFGFAQKTLILLVMQSLDYSIKLRLQRSWWFPWRRKLQTVGRRIPTYIPQANQFAQRLAEAHNGSPLTASTEIFLNVPTTAHMLGGAAMGNSAEEGVVDGQNRVFNYKNMLVCDGSMIGTNLGVNPSLTITALTEHAMSHILHLKESDFDGSLAE